MILRRLLRRESCTTSFPVARPAVADPGELSFEQDDPKAIRSRYRYSF
jgi:hypothetical protein